MRIAVYRPEWGTSPDGWNILFHDTNVNGYDLMMQYFENCDKWSVLITGNGEICSFDYYPATDNKGWEYPDIETVLRMVGDAFDSQGKEVYYKPEIHFKQAVQERFGMSVDELYALSED